MRFNRQIKKGAKSALRGNWGKLMTVFLIFIGFWLLLSTTEALLYTVFGFTPYTDPMMTPGNFLDNLPAHALGEILITSGITLLWLLLFSPLLCGGARWLHSLTAGETPELRLLFVCFVSFRRYCRSVFAAALVLFKAVFWLAMFAALPAGITIFFRMFPFPPSSPLAMFAGYGVTAGWVLMTIALFFYLIFLQRYSLVFYYLSEDETLSARKAIKQSVRTMDGHCGEVFSLRLSFFWWMLLSPLVLPLLYTVPYYFAALAIYARYRMECRRRDDETPSTPPAEWMEKPEDPAGELPEPTADDKTQEYPVSEVAKQMEQENE